MIDSSDTGMRARATENGGITWVQLLWCDNRDNHRRGPDGGVCWCGNAIPRTIVYREDPDEREYNKPHGHYHRGDES